jgi:dihydrofolate reductase
LWNHVRTVSALTAAALLTIALSAAERSSVKIIVYLASSINGQISNKRGVPDWLSQEYGKTFWDTCQQTQAVIMGKTTYNILAPDNLPLKSDGMIIVRSHDTPTAPVQANVLFTDKTPKDIDVSAGTTRDD